MPCNNSRPGTRFIPAGAGNTALSLPAHQPSAVYPRWRGEHWSNRTLCGDRTGLSPLARGTRLDRVLLCRWFRFIPAGAGNTWRRLQAMAPDAVYPRWRGEHNICAPEKKPMPGLSPLARGTHWIDCWIGCFLRFIPAGAGNTQ